MPIFLVVLRRPGPEYDHSKPLEELSGWDEHAVLGNGSDVIPAR